MIDRVRGYTSFLIRSAFLTAKGAVVARIKYSQAFWQRLAELEQSQWLSSSELRELQNRKLRALVAHVYEHVPYYRRLFDQRGLKPRDVETAEDLKKLPLLTKDLLRANAHDLVARGVAGQVALPGWTTGSTGSPINAVRTREAIVFENAMIWRQRRLAGVQPGDTKAVVWGTIWGNVIIPSSRRHLPPYWRWNLAERQLLFSYYHMTDETLHRYFDRMEKSGVVCIEGFPSTMLVLAQHLRRHNRTVPLKAIFTSSEPLYRIHRDLIEERFQTKVFDLYGQAERVVAATECERHDGLHLNQEYGITEVLKEGGECRDNEVGEIVGTGLNNYAMPLIRYCTGDLARLSHEPCGCGRQMGRLSAVEGRLADLIHTLDGRTVPGNGIMGAFHGIGNLRRTQVVQNEPSTVHVKIVKAYPDQGVDLESLKKNLQACLGAGMTVYCEFVSDSDLESGPKYRWVVSRIGQEHGPPVVDC